MAELQSYSQVGQDLICLSVVPALSACFEIFSRRWSVRQPSLPQYAFFEQGWDRICLELVTKNHQKLKEAYRHTNVVTLRVAATDYGGAMELNVATIPWSPGWGSDVSSELDDICARRDKNWQD